MKQDICSHLKMLRINQTTKKNILFNVSHLQVVLPNGARQIPASSQAVHIFTTSLSTPHNCHLITSLFAMWSSDPDCDYRGTRLKHKGLPSKVQFLKKVLHLTSSGHREYSRLRTADQFSRPGSGVWVCVVCTHLVSTYLVCFLASSPWG